MKPILTRIATGIAIVFLLASCTTLQRTTDEGGAAYVAGLLNDGQAVKLAKLSSSPFLVDGEIIALPEDTAAFWEGVVKAGIRLDPERFGRPPSAPRRGKSSARRGTSSSFSTSQV